MPKEAARILNAGKAMKMKPQPINKLITEALHAFKKFGTRSQGDCNSELIRFPMLAIGKASDQVAVWLFCAVSSRLLFQELEVLSKTVSEFSQARFNIFISI